MKRKNPIYYEVKADQTTSPSGLLRIIGMCDGKTMLSIGKEMAILDQESLDNTIFYLARLRNNLVPSKDTEEKNKAGAEKDVATTKK